jgi:L-asparaginase II
MTFPQQPTPCPILILERSGIPELTFHGALEWFSPTGERIHSLGGDPVIYGRSSIKPWMIGPFQNELVRELRDPRHLAIAVSSHDGTEIHVNTARAVLDSHPELCHALATPPSLPMNSDAAKALAGPSCWHNACSGEHAALLLGLKLRGLPTQDYIKPNSPYLALYINHLRSILGPDWKPAKVACDGCGLPTLAHPLSDLARLYADITGRALDPTTSEHRIWKAMSGHPEIVGGDTRSDTLAMQAAPGALIAKEGADGLMGISVLPCPAFPEGVGIAIKFHHAFDRQWMPWLLKALLGAMDAAWGRNLKAPPLPRKQGIVFNPEIVPVSLRAGFARFQKEIDQISQRERESAKWGAS